ncbi:MAG: protein-export chaperone SecB [Cryomorphaceae bacterium]|nr:protein-export chaperone SecB [Cryomorphaceae bacterium]
MQKAAFSIESYQFDKVTLDLGNQVSNDVMLDFDTKGIFHEADKKFELIFSVVAFNEEKTINNPFVSIRCKGVFTFENVKSFEEIPVYFYRNSIAILFPYVRAYISLITSQANIPGIILPTMNLSSLEEKLKASTTK